MEFIVAVLRRLHDDRAVGLSAAASETYYQTLQRYHGWIVTGTFTVALKLVPSRRVCDVPPRRQRRALPGLAGSAQGAGAAAAPPTIPLS
jgi:hypothetical protein